MAGAHALACGQGYAASSDLSALLPTAAEELPRSMVPSPSSSLRPVLGKEALSGSQPKALGSRAAATGRPSKAAPPLHDWGVWCEGTENTHTLSELPCGATDSHNDVGDAPKLGDMPHALVSIQASLDRMELAMSSLKLLPVVQTASPPSVIKKSTRISDVEFQGFHSDAASQPLSSPQLSSQQLSSQFTEPMLVSEPEAPGSSTHLKRFNSSCLNGQALNRSQLSTQSQPLGTSPHNLRAGVPDAGDTLGRFKTKSCSRGSSGGVGGFAGAAVEKFAETNVGRRLAASMGSATNVVQTEESKNSWKERMKQLAGNQYFDLFCGVMILLNTLLIGIETDYLTNNDRTSNELRLAQVVLNVWYICEFCLRLAGARCLFFIGPEKNWNMFDTCLVATSVLDLLAESVEIGGLDLGRVVRAVRLARVMRTLRIVRLLRYLREFRKMVYAMVSSIKTLFWSLILLLFVMYAFAIWLTQGVTDYVRGGDVQDDLVERLDVHFGSLPTTVYTLYKSITAGMGWGDAASLLLEFSMPYMAIFIVFLSISIFGLLNIVTSVFVESAMNSAQHSRELMVQDKLKDKEVYMKHLRTIFMAIDMDDSGLINETELTAFLRDEGAQVQTYMEALDLNGSNPHVLFTLLDDDNSGCIDFEEFYKGCLQLKGEATAFDVHCLRYDTQRTQEHLNHFMSHVEDRLELITRIVADNRGARIAALPPIPVGIVADGWTDEIMGEQNTRLPTEKNRVPELSTAPGIASSGLTAAVSAAVTAEDEAHEVLLT